MTESQAAAAGVEQAFADLRERLHSYLRGRLADPSQADDLLHDVFVKALSALQAGRRIDNLGAWLFTTTRTTLADFYRARGAPTVELDDSIPADDTDETRRHQDLAACLRPMIERLPTLYRDTLIATDLEGRSMSDVAAAEGRSVSAIKSRAARGRAMVKAELLDCCTIETRDGWVIDYRRRGR